MSHSLRVQTQRLLDALRSRDRSVFVQQAAMLITSDAQLGDVWQTIATGLIDFGEFTLARRAADALVKSSQQAKCLEQATIYARTGMVTEARAIIGKAAGTAAKTANLAYLRGTLALNDGDLEEARGFLLEAARLMPGSGQIWQTLSSTGSMADHGDVRDAILAVEGSMRLSPDRERAAFLYALGKTLDDLGDHSKAFQAFESGAKIVARMRPYSHAQDLAGSKMATGWTRDDLLTFRSQPTVGSERPIFVTGMPRSGSTLVEQILASHSSVVGGEELMRFSMIVREIGGFDVPTVRAWAGSQGMDSATALYLHLFTERFGPIGRAVDKTLETSRYLGMIAAAFPDAPIIWMRRDPLDNAWSCFRTYFLMGLGWSFSPSTIAQHRRLEDHLLAHWEDRLGDQMLVVDYEHLVADKERKISQILKHCNLSIEPQVFHPERKRRAVVTSSVTQVRAPIHTDAVGAGKRHTAFAEPFLQAYSQPSRL